jgi:putative oxidoreductase
MVGKGIKLAWFFQIVLFIAFLIFGVAKFLVPPEQAAQVFGNIGGTTAQYFTGAYQIISAILVIMPSTAFIGALLIIIAMTVAIILHFTILGFEGPFLVLTIIAVVMIILAIYVMKWRRKDLFCRN